MKEVTRISRGCRSVFPHLFAIIYLAFVLPITGSPRQQVMRRLEIVTTRYESVSGIGLSRHWQVRSAGSLVIRQVLTLHGALVDSRLSEHWEPSARTDLFYNPSLYKMYEVLYTGTNYSDRDLRLG